MVFVFQIVFARNSHYALADLSKSAYDVIQLDWGQDPVTARNTIGADKTLQVRLSGWILIASMQLFTHTHIPGQPRPHCALRASCCHCSQDQAHGAEYVNTRHHSHNLRFVTLFCCGCMQSLACRDT
jgi:hypothetical protein